MDDKKIILDGKEITQQVLFEELNKSGQRLIEVKSEGNTVEYRTLKRMTT